MEMELGSVQTEISELKPHTLHLTDSTPTFVFLGNKGSRETQMPYTFVI